MRVRDEKIQCPSQVVWSYVRHALVKHHGERWLAVKASRIGDAPEWPELLTKYSLKGVGRDSRLGLAGWLSGRYPLKLRRDIPTPREMLDIQCEGERFVTLLEAPEDQEREIGRHHGALAFLLHDLEHAHKFFADPELYRGQTRFFRLLRAELRRFERWGYDPLFAKDLDYLISDMNSHPVHLFKFLKAVTLGAVLRQSGAREVDLGDFWREVLSAWQASPEVSAAALRINHPGEESTADRELLAEFFARGFDSEPPCVKG